MLKTALKVLKTGGWAPLFVFAIHVFAGRVINIYEIWPATDIPMHISGGLAIAYFVSRCFQELPRGVALQRSRSTVLELLLIGSLTATSAIFWEFSEFISDQIFGSNVQVSLANTMQDLAMGVLGATTFMMMRAWQLRVGPRELREVTSDWVRGRVA